HVTHRNVGPTNCYLSFALENTVPITRTVSVSSRGYRCCFRAKGRFHAEPSGSSSAFPRRDRRRGRHLSAVEHEANFASRPALPTGGPVARRAHFGGGVRTPTRQGISGRSLLRANPDGAQKLFVGERGNASRRPGRPVVVPTDRARGGGAALGGTFDRCPGLWRRGKLLCRFAEAPSRSSGRRGSGRR